MAYGLPEGLWLPLLVMTIIILALLWKDKISKSSSSGSTKTRKEGPSVSMKTAGSDHTKENTFVLTGSYSSGDGSIKRKSLKMNGRDIGSKISSWSGGSFRTSEINIPDTESVKCKIEIETQHGDAYDRVSFRPSEPGEPDGPGLDIEVDTTNSDPGEENGSVEITASPEKGDAEIRGTEVKVPELNKSESVSGRGNCVIRISGLAPGKYEYIAETVDGNNKEARDRSEFTIEQNKPEENNLIVEADYEILSHSEGKVIIEAEVVETSLDIEGTSIKMKPIEGGEDDWIGTSNDRPRVQFEHEGLPEGTYEYEGKAVDIEHDEAFDQGRFEIGSGGTPGETPDDVPEGFPSEWGAIFQNTNINGIPPGILGLLGDIGEETAGKDRTGDVTQEVGMEAEQLLLALSVLEPDLSGQDNSKIIDELREIKQKVSQDQMSSNDLENSMKVVLQDVFGADLKNVIKGLDVDGGFDEQKIVQAIRDNQVDIDPLAKRLSKIEQTISQVQTQGGGDLTDLERKLDEIEAAIKDTQIDESMMQQFMTQIQNMESEGVEVDVDAGGMDEAVMLRLMDDIQDSGDPDVEMESILEVIREQGRLNRELIKELIEEEEEGHRRGVVNPVNMTKDPDSSGGKGNKNEQEVEDIMAKANTLQHIDQAENALSNLKHEQEQIEDDIVDAEKSLKDLQETLHDAIKHENHLDNVLDDGNMKNPSKVKENYGPEIQKIKEDIKRAIKDYRRFEKDAEEIQKLVDREEDATNQIKKLDDAVGTSVEHVEQLAEKLDNAYNVNLDINPQVNFT